MMITQTETASSRFPRVHGADDGRAETDEALLHGFLNGGEEASEAAFKTLVTRYGPMVLGVCRQVLHHLDEADDAFQAAFLVLARNAGSIRDPRVLSRWLYEVAYRIAIRSRARSARRRSHEKEAAVTSDLGRRPEGDPAWNELRPVLHEEVNRLPEKYRSPVILCYLEGRTNEEAAELLSWPVGTVKGRLSRARELLRSRLTRRGLALSAAFLALRLSHDAAFAEVVSPRLIDATVQSVLADSRSQLAGGMIPDRIRELIDDGLLRPARSTGRSWLRTGIRLILATFLLLGSLAVAEWCGLPARAAIPSFIPFLSRGGGAGGTCH